MAGRLYVVEDDLMFAQRARAAAQRLGVLPLMVSAGQALRTTWHPDDVVVVQATLRPDHQLALIKHLTASDPAPIVVAVTGHLETELRRDLKLLGARLAAHSAMDRVLARALGLSDGARDPGATSHRD